MWSEILAENACKGLGKLGKLLLGRFLRQDDYKNILMQAQAEKDALAIASGEKVFDGERLLPAWDLSHLPASSLPHLIGLEEESNNLNATLKITADILKDTPEEEVADESVDPDWFKPVPSAIQRCGSSGDESLLRRSSPLKLFL